MILNSFHASFVGIGLSSTVIIFLTLSYYAVILAWSLFYLFHSFQTTLPWSSCNNTWNNPPNSTKECSSNLSMVTAQYKKDHNFTEYQPLSENDSTYLKDHYTSSVEEYYKWVSYHYFFWCYITVCVISDLTSWLLAKKMQKVQKWTFHT